MGAPVNDDEFKKAARRLGDTGVFTDIGYSYSYSSAEQNSNSKSPMPASLCPRDFEDFVWFTDAEIRRRIKEHSPLFDGELPLSGGWRKRFPTCCRPCWWNDPSLGTWTSRDQVSRMRPWIRSFTGFPTYWYRSGTLNLLAQVKRSSRSEIRVPKAYRSRILANSSECAGTTPASSHFLLERISQGCIRGSRIEDRKRAVCEK